MQPDAISSETQPSIPPLWQDMARIIDQDHLNLFISGRAGTGKSSFLSFYRAQSHRKPVILAPTGVAALNVGGQTIHSFFQFPPDITALKIRNKTLPPPINRRLYQALEMIILDEISMVRADMLDCIDAFLRLYGPVPDQAFGGVQMIFVGDLYQLPPILPQQHRELFYSQYDSPYFFSAHALRETELYFIEMTTIYRQDDENFINFLDRLRLNELEYEDIEHFNEICLQNYNQADDSSFIFLTTTNQRADAINYQRLEQLSGQPLTLPAQMEGRCHDEQMPTACDLYLKTGAQVMLLNNDPKKRWVNGTIGILQGLSKDKEGEDCLQVWLKTNQGQELISLHSFTWQLYNYHLSEEGDIDSSPTASFTQFPVRLAWAMTIHRSQGKTFDSLTLDIGQRTFAPGQLYVALSRCRNMRGVRLLSPIQSKHIWDNQIIHDFMSSCRRGSQALC